jgi:hypothetical protein
MLLLIYFSSRIVALLASLANLKRHPHHIRADGGVVPDRDRGLGVRRLRSDLKVGVAKGRPNSINTIPVASAEQVHILKVTRCTGVELGPLTVGIAGKKVGWVGHRFARAAWKACGTCTAGNRGSCHSLSAIKVGWGSGFVLTTISGSISVHLSFLLSGGVGIGHTCHCCALPTIVLIESHSGDYKTDCKNYVVSLNGFLDISE